MPKTEFRLEPIVNQAPKPQEVRSFNKEEIINIVKKGIENGSIPGGGGSGTFDTDILSKCTFEYDGSDTTITFPKGVLPLAIYTGQFITFNYYGSFACNDDGS